MSDHRVMRLSWLFQQSELRTNSKPLGLGAGYCLLALHVQERAVARR